MSRTCNDVMLSMATIAYYHSNPAPLPHRILSQEPVVEVEKCFTITGAAAHIWLKDDEAHLSNKIVQSAQETAHGLRLRTSVNAYQHGKSGGHAPRVVGDSWIVCNSADDAAVK